MPIDPTSTDTSTNDSNINALLGAAIELCAAGIASALAKEGIAVVTAAIPQLARQILRNDLRNLSLRPAGIGRAQTAQHDATVRSDAIAWMDGSTPPQRAWLDAMELLRCAINRDLFLGLFDYESHYAHYQPAQFYRRHRDVFAGSDVSANTAHSRVLSTICYLNDSWQESDAGELVVFDNNEKPLLKIAPLPGTLIVFLSQQFPHEVLPTTIDRFSVAGWFRRS